MEMVDRVTGEVLSEEDVEFAYTREGRKEVGREFPNPVPMAPPLGFVPTPPLWETIRAMVQREMSQQAAAADAETFEEADDFEVGDDYDPTSPFEEVFEPDQPWPPSRQVENAEQDAPAAAEDVARLRRELAEAEKRAGGPRPPDNVAPPQGARPEDANPGA